ncbi:MAG: PepSY domain-containing protein [Geminicoccales bacterium]
MKTTNLLLISALALSTASAYAVETGDVLGTSEADIRANLEIHGYDVQSIIIDGDEIEIDALLDGQKFEIELSSDAGAVLEIEPEDEDDDDDDEVEDDDD